jgi:hypothetical protein
VYDFDIKLLESFSKCRQWICLKFFAGKRECEDDWFPCNTADCKRSNTKLGWNGLPKLVWTFTHGKFGLVSIDHFFVALDLFSIDYGAYFRCQVFDRKRRTTRGVMRLP